jgi:hypothetical protein
MHQLNKVQTLWRIDYVLAERSKKVVVKLEPSRIPSTKPVLCDWAVS